MRKSFYHKLIQKKDGFKVFIVDGKFIRDNIDEEFTNFGQHYRFKFIPEDEFWIDKEHSKRKETKYFVDHLMIEYKLMHSGKKYPEALYEADWIEREERRKSKLIKGHHKKFYDLIHKRKWHDLPNLKIWIVDGELIRDLYYVDFTEGGHDLIYHFIPKKEIWIDDDVDPEERNLVLLHELHERRLMREHKKLCPKIKTRTAYVKAHFAASKLEKYYRHHPKGLPQRVKEEIELANC